MKLNKITSILAAAALILGGLYAAPVTAEAETIATEITLGLNVYYNDAELAYYNNELAPETVTITGDGTYTLTFDCATDLSEAAVNAGVTSLTNLTAIYIKDCGIADGTWATTPLDSCDIMYDEILVDGIALTINQTEPKSAIKSSGILDTNDPINGWDGSAVDEVAAVDNAASFTTIENPTTISITFTLSNVVFTEATEEAEEEAEEATDDADDASDADDAAADDAEASTTSTDAEASGSSTGVVAVVVIVIVVVIAAVLVVSKKKK